MEPATMASMTLAGLGVASFGGVIGVSLLKTKFVTKVKCKEEQDKCQYHLCLKIDDLKINIQTQISAIDKKREKAREENLIFVEKISTHMGATNAIIKKYMTDENDE